MIRPQVFPCKDTDSKERTDLKKMTNLMKDDNAIVVFQDEVHFEQQTSVTRMWYKKAQNQRFAPDKKSIAYSGYIVQNTGELIMTKPGWFNYETVIDSIREFKIDDGKKLHLILDSAPWHRKAIRLIQDEKLPEYTDIRKKNCT